MYEQCRNEAKLAAMIYVPTVFNKEDHPVVLWGLPTYVCGLNGGTTGWEKEKSNMDLAFKCS